MGAQILAGDACSAPVHLRTNSDSWIPKHWEPGFPETGISSSVHAKQFPFWQSRAALSPLVPALKSRDELQVSWLHEFRVFGRGWEIKMWGASKGEKERIPQFAFPRARGRVLWDTGLERISLPKSYCAFSSLSLKYQTKVSKTGSRNHRASSKDKKLMIEMKIQLFSRIAPEKIKASNYSWKEYFTGHLLLHVIHFTIKNNNIF